MTAPVIPVLERPQYVALQRLEPDDLASLFRYQREVRWLHNRSLHSWGVASGFIVEAAVGDRDVRVGAGYAIDAAGRDLMLTEGVTLPVPPVNGGSGSSPARFHLTVSYIADDDLPIADSRIGVCGPGGVVRRNETPRLRFQDPAGLGPPETRFRPGLDIVLATIEVRGCVLSSAPTYADRVSARTPVTPRIAAGRTDPLKTIWRFATTVGGSQVGVETTVDTSEAGFASAPMYAVQLLGERILVQKVGTADGIMLDGIVSVQQPRANSFVLRVTMPRDQSLPGWKLNPGSRFVPITLDQLRVELQWQVAWMGTET